MDDAQTVAYFDEYCPEYSLARVRDAVDFIESVAQPGTRVADVGCGAGNVLEAIREATGLDRVMGFDPSPEMVALAASHDGVEARVASVLDTEAMAEAGTFDVVLLAAVLHHLVGNTRAASSDLGDAGLLNAWQLVADGGHLVVVEPTYEPRWAGTAVFWLKRIVTRFTQRRIPIGGTWNNIGAPVVSFYDSQSLVEAVDRLPGAELIAIKRRPKRVPTIPRRLGIRRRDDTTLVVRKR